MIIVTRKFTRPSTEVKFWNMPKEGAGLFNEKYKDRCLYRNKTLENNDLTLVVQAIWDSQESLTEYQNDPAMQVYFAARNQHNIENNITAGERTIENA